MSKPTTKRARRHGFTLVELMIAMIAGGVTITAAYYLGTTSSRSFNNQMRVTETQSSLRAAMDQVQRDISRAGFLSTPEIGLERNCYDIANAKAPNAYQPVLRGVSVDLNASKTLNPAGAPDLRDLLGPKVRMDSLMLFGNYGDGDMYKISGDSSGNLLFFETNRESFRRSFVTASNAVDVTHYNDVFRNGRIVRIDSDRHVFFRQIIGSANNTITLDEPIPEACFKPTTAFVTPLSFVRYNLEVLVGSEFARISATNSIRAGSAGKAALVRRELDYVAGAFVPRSTRVVLDYATEFEVNPIVQGATVGTWTMTLPVNAPGPVLNATQLPRSLRVTLSARAEDVDTKLPAPPDRGNDPLSLNPMMGAPVKVGAVDAWARVRTLRQDLFLPNMRF